MSLITRRAGCSIRLVSRQLIENPAKEEITMAVKHVPTNEVHSGNKGGYTGCGFDTRDNPTHWVSTHERITCDKNGCKN